MWKLQFVLGDTNGVRENRVGLSLYMNCFKRSWAYSVIDSIIIRFGLLGIVIKSCIEAMLFKCSILVVLNHQNRAFEQQCSDSCWIYSQQDMVECTYRCLTNTILLWIAFPTYVTKNIKPLCLNHVNIHTLYCRNYQWYSW